MTLQVDNNPNHHGIGVNHHTLYGFPITVRMQHARGTGEIEIVE